MAVSWSPARTRRIDALLKDYTLASPCAEVARRLLPIAREHDLGSRGLIVRANAGQTRYGILRPGGQAPDQDLWWHYHVTVLVEQHCVDVLTGTPGTARDGYLETHFDNHAGDLRFDESDPDLVDSCL